MIPTEALRNRLRKLLDEPIPEGGSDADTRFTDEDLDILLTEANNIYGAAAAGWIQKAGMLQREVGEISRYSVGQETYEMQKLNELVDYALKMAQTYAQLASKTVGSVVVRLEPPEVL